MKIQIKPVLIFSVCMIAAFSCPSWSGDVGNGDGGAIPTGNSVFPQKETLVLKNPLIFTAYSCKLNTRSGPRIVIFEGNDKQAIIFYEKSQKQFPHLEPALRFLMRKFDLGFECRKKTEIYKTFDQIPKADERFNEVRPSALPGGELTDGIGLDRLTTDKFSNPLLKASSGENELYRNSSQEDARAMEHAFWDLGLDQKDHVEFSFKKNSDPTHNSQIELELQKFLKVTDSDTSPVASPFQVFAPKTKSLLTFDWSGKDPVYIRSNNPHISISTGEQSPVHVGFEIPVELTPGGIEYLSQVNHELDAAQINKTYEDLAYRPSVMSYLYWADHDIDELTAMRKTVLDPLYADSSKGTIQEASFLAIGNSVRDRLLKTVTNVYATSQDYSLATSWITQADPRTVDPRDYEFLLMYSDIQSDEQRLASIKADVSTGVELLGFVTPDEENPSDITKAVKITKLSPAGCKIIPHLVEAIGVFYSDYLYYLPKAGMDDRFSRSEYITGPKGVTSVLRLLRTKLNYNQESPLEFLTKTLGDWNKVCTPEEQKEIQSKLKRFEKR